MQADHPVGGRLADVQVAHHIGIEQRHPDNQQQHRRFLDRRSEYGRQILGLPHPVDPGQQQQRQQRAQARRFGRRREAPIQRYHHADQQHDERQHARQHLDLLRQCEMLVFQIGRFLATFFVDGQRRLVLLVGAEHGIAGKQHHQQDAGAYPGQEQAAQRLFGRHRVQYHGDRRRQQDTQRAAGGDDAGREAGRVAALAHFGDAGRADRRAGGRRGTSHGREQRAGKHVGDAQSTGYLVQPGVDRRIQVFAGRRLADGRALQDKQRYRQQRDRGHFLVYVLGDGIERAGRHAEVHEAGRHHAQRKGDRHPGEHHHQSDGAVQGTQGQVTHRALPADLLVARISVCSSSCSASSVMPAAIIA